MSNYSDRLKNVASKVGDVWSLVVIPDLNVTESSTSVSVLVSLVFVKVNESEMFEFLNTATNATVTGRVEKIPSYNDDGSFDGSRDKMVFEMSSSELAGWVTYLEEQILGE